MNILFLKAYYEPESVASSYLSDNLLEAFCDSGHNVDLITPMPTRGISDAVRKSYVLKRREYKFNGQLKIHRFRMFKEHKNPVLRALRYVLSGFAYIYRAFKLKNIDLVFAASTPPIMGVIAGSIAKIKNVPFIYTLQDIFPDSLVNTGMTRSGSFLWRIGRIIENYTYKNAKRIIVISEDFKQNVIRKGVSEEKIEVIYNWVDENAVKPVERKDNHLFEEYNLDRESFYITHCGNIGFTQNMDMLMEVAKALEMYKDIYFILIGEGAYKGEVRRLIAEKNLNNVRLLPFQPYEYISEVFSLGDVGLIISKLNIGQNSVPSKTWSIMAAERFALVSFDMDSELSRIISAADCGICVPAGQKEMLEDTILELYHNKPLIARKGRNGRKYILDNLTRDKGTEKYMKVLNAALEHNS